MLPLQRREHILTELHKERFLSVADLAQRLSASISTIRRDLVELEREGVAVRTHGGAGLTGGWQPEEIARAVRAEKRVGQKEAIGRAAARLLTEVGTVILDAGTTTMEVARNLHPTDHLRVVTDSLDIAWELKDRENVTVILTGGILRAGAYNLFGPTAEQSIMTLHAEVCVMGCTGLTVEDGLFKHDIEALPVRRRMVEASRKLIVTCDSSKLGKNGLVNVCGFELIDTVVTDAEISPAFRLQLEENGVAVVIAD